MIVRVFDDNDWATYYCTLCNRPFKALQEANEHAKFCGQAVPTQPVFRSYTTAATFEDTEFDGRIGDDDDDTQVYKKPWVGLTPEEVLDLFDVNNVYGSKWIEFARTVEAALKKKNT